MKLLPGVMLVILATLCLGFAALASALSSPLGLSGRDVFVLMLGAAGVAFAALAARELRGLGRRRVATGC